MALRVSIRTAEPLVKPATLATAAIVAVAGRALLLLPVPPVNPSAAAAVPATARCEAAPVVVLVREVNGGRGSRWRSVR